MIWIYVALGVSVALNVGLGIALCIVSKKHKIAASQLRYYRKIIGSVMCPDKRAES
jgi:hypothetical protein